MNLPKKLLKGQQFKDSTVTTINQIIDYLKSQRIVGDNKFCVVQESPSGIYLTAKTPSVTNKGGGSNATNMPWQMMQDPQNSNYFIINKAVMVIDGNDTDQITWSYRGVNHLPLPTQVGIYHVWGVATYSNNAYSNWDYSVIMVDNARDDIRIANVPGLQKTYIGTITVTLVGDDKQYNFWNNNLSGFNVFEAELSNYFHAHFFKTLPQEGTIITSNFDPAKIYINGGKFIFGERLIYCGGYNADVATGIYFVHYVESTDTATIILGDVNTTFYNQGVWNIPLCQVQDTGRNGYKVTQFIDNIFTVGGDDGKVKVTSSDTLDYLSNKFGNTETVTFYSQNNKIYANAIGGSSGGYGQIISGSLDNWLEYSINSTTNNRQLRFKPQYSAHVSQFLFLAQDANGQMIGQTWSADEGIKDGVLCWDYSTNNPISYIPPVASAGQVYYLAGDAYNGLTWQSADILPISSPHDTIDITSTASAVQIDVNTNIFKSDDESIIISATASSVNFKNGINVIGGSNCDVQSSGNTYTVNCSATKVTSGNGISVTKSGDTYTITNLHDVVGGNGITVDKAGNTFTVNCNINVTGTDPISVSKSGNNYNVSFDGLNTNSPHCTLNLSYGAGTIYGDVNTNIFDCDDNTITVQKTVSSVNFKNNINIVGTNGIDVVKDGNIFCAQLDVVGNGLLAFVSGHLVVIPIGSGVAVGDGATIAWQTPVECE